MFRRSLVNCTVFASSLGILAASLLTMPSAARAQGGEVLDAGGQGAADAGAARPVATSTMPAPAPAPTATEETPRPARGPSVRERGGRRSRGASTASGALMLFILVGAIGYYVIKKLRR